MTSQQGSLSRRDFLRLLTVASSTLILHSRLSGLTPAHGQKPLRVLVVGQAFQG